MKKKSEFTERVLELIMDMESKYGGKVKFIRCDNAGENERLKKIDIGKGTWDNV